MITQKRRTRKELRNGQIQAQLIFKISSVSILDSIFFLSTNYWCLQQIKCNEVILEDLDITKALIDYVSANSVEILVLGAASRGGLVRYIPFLQLGQPCSGLYTFPVWKFWWFEKITMGGMNLNDLTKMKLHLNFMYKIMMALILVVPKWGVLEPTWWCISTRDTPVWYRLLLLLLLFCFLENEVVWKNCS